MELPDTFFDIHICGVCRAQFHDVVVFLDHKRRCPALAKLVADMQQRKRQQSTAQPSGSASVRQPLLSPRQQFSMGAEQEDRSVDGTPAASLTHSHSPKTQLVEYAEEPLQQHASHLQMGSSPSCEQTFAGTGLQRRVSFPADSPLQHGMQLRSSQLQDQVEDVTDLRKGLEESTRIQQGQSEFTSTTQSLLHSQLTEMLTMAPQEVPITSFSSMPSVPSLSRDNIAVSTTDVQKPQQLVSQADFARSQQSPARMSVRSGLSPQQGKKQGMHTIVVQHSPIKQTEQSSLLHAVNKSLAGVELQLQSQQLQLSAPKERGEVPKKRAHRSQSAVYPHHQSLETYVCDETQEFPLTQMPAAESSSSGSQSSSQELHGARISSLGPHTDLEHPGSELVMPLPEAKNLLQTRQDGGDDVGDTDVLNPNSAVSAIDSPLHKTLMSEIQGMASPDSGFEHNYRLVDGRSSHHTAGGRDSSEKRRRHADGTQFVSMTLSMSPLTLATSPPPKRVHREPSELQTPPSSSRYSFADMQSDVSTHESASTTSAHSKDVIVSTTTLQDLAASELGASLPDSLVTSHLISTHTPSGCEGAADLLHATDDEHLFLPPATQLGSAVAGVKSPEGLLLPLVETAAKVLQSENGTMEPHTSDQLGKTLVDTELQGPKKSADTSSSPKNRKVYRCRFESCNYETTYTKDMHRHERKHTGERPYKCPHCGKNFNRSDKLRVHIRWHTGDKPFKCSQCDYASMPDLPCSVKGNLKSHYKINHSPENQLQCEKCDFASSSQKLMREHLKKHTSGQKCPVCKYICSTTASLRNHLRVHSDERPYRCDFCSYSAKQQGNVKAHMKKRHADKLRASRRHGRSKMAGGSSTSKRVSATDLRRPAPVEEEIGDAGGDTGGRAIRTSSKKMHQCFLCEASFVREDSLRCHLRCHRDTPAVVGSNQTLILQQQPASVQQDGLAGMPPPQGFYIQLETELPENAVPVQVAKPSRYAKSAVSETKPKSRKSQRSQSGRSVSFRGLDHIADAAARMYQEQYDIQPQVLDPAGERTQHVQIVQVPVELDTTRYTSSGMVDDFSQGGRVRGSTVAVNQEGTESELDELDDKHQMFVENLIISDGGQPFVSSSSSYQTLIEQTALQQNPAMSSAYMTSSRSTPATAVSSPGNAIVTYFSSPVKSTSQASQVTFLMSPPTPESQAQQPAQSVSNNSFVTYMSPPLPSPSQLQQPSSQVVQFQLQQQQPPPQPLQIMADYAEKQVVMADTSPRSLPVSYTLTSLPVSHLQQQTLSSSAGIISMASSGVQTTSSSSRRSSRSVRHKYIKSGARLAPSPSVSAFYPSPAAPTLPVSNILSLVSSSISPVLPTSGLSSGVLASNKPQAAGQQSMQFQLQPVAPTQPPPQQVILQPQQQFVVQDPQQTVQLQQADLPINVQVIHQDGGQQQQLQQTIPVNIIPVNEETSAVMIGNRLVSLPNNLLQMILSQLQSGVNVSLSEDSDDGQGPVSAVQEVVIHVDPQHVSSAAQTLVFKKEQPGWRMLAVHFSLLLARRSRIPPLTVWCGQSCLNE
ncbi:hypothetical protein BaRGS_00003106, partial [Batillaria attramentaria]